MTKRYNSSTKGSLTFLKLLIYSFIINVKRASLIPLLFLTNPFVHNLRRSITQMKTNFWLNNANVDFIQNITNIFSANFVNKYQNYLNDFFYLKLHLITKNYKFVWQRSRRNPRPVRNELIFRDWPKKFGAQHEVSTICKVDSLEAT